MYVCIVYIKMVYVAKKKCSVSFTGNIVSI